MQRPSGPGRRTAALALAAALVLASCAARDRPAPPGPTTTTVPARWPLTGQLVRAPGRAPRPAVALKVENVAQARPQAGLNAADLVFEELVEGGLTRLMAVFHSEDAPLVGPVRSVREVDVPLLRQFGPVLFGYSGGAAAVIKQVERDSGAVLVGADRAAGAYSRRPGRPAPHNLFTSTGALRAAISRQPGPPRAPFTYAAALPAGAKPATSARLTFSPAASAAWRWDRSAGAWLRSQGGSKDVLADGSQVRADDVVIMAVQIGRSNVVDVLGNPTPSIKLLGSGPAWVLRDGHVLKGRWSRSSLDQPASLSQADGEALALSPGRTWVELLPSSQAPVIG